LLESTRVLLSRLYRVPLSICIGHLNASDERMAVAQEELQDLKGVWAELSKIWQQIDELKERPWLSVQPRKVLLKTNSVHSINHS